MERLYMMETFKDILNLGMHPFADTFITNSDAQEPVIPLIVTKNFDTGLLKLKYDTSSMDRYNYVDYSYTSNNSITAKKHWDGFAEYANLNIKNFSKIVEVGSNDGQLLLRFKNNGHKVFGIDASVHMCKLSEGVGINSINSYFDSKTADHVIKYFGTVDMVIANNVLNHANDVTGFLFAVKTILKDDGIFIFEVPSWFEMVKDFDFPDMVYHEHFYYFTLRSIVNLADATGMHVCGFDLVDYHGGSFRITVQKIGGKRLFKDRSKFENYIKKEIDYNIFSFDFYSRYNKQLLQYRKEWLKGFYRLLYSNKYDAIIGIGAAAKANTWINWMGLSSRDFTCITDASSLKQGKLTPLSRIPIKPDSILKDFKKPLVIILSWNLREQLENIVLKHNPNCEFY